MKKTILNLIALTMVVSAFANGEHHDWEDHHVLQINREPARAYFIPYGEKQGDRILSLNGDWQFRWTKTPEGRIKDFWHTDFDASGWKTLAVPANWEVNGYGTPIYVSAGPTRSATLRGSIAVRSRCPLVGKRVRPSCASRA